MTATSLGLNGAPKFLGAYLTNLSSNLGLAQSPSTCSVTLTEDECSNPPVIFNAPEPGDFYIVTAGEFTFAGIITSYNMDVANIGGRQIQVALSDPREIMGSVPMIIAPGYRAVAAQIALTNCSVIDVFGAFDDSNGTGLNVSGWNQSGMPYKSIALALKGGITTNFNSNFNVVGQVAKAFGEKYRFNLDAVTAKVDPGYRVNSNLLTVSDMLQELASRHSFDWFVDSTRSGVDGIIDVVIKTIDRSTDNVDIGFDAFLAANSGFVIDASRGYELRNDVSCAVLLGAPIEQLRALGCNGMANNPVDLATEGFSAKYFMQEIEMRYVLSGKEEWKQWVSDNGGLDRYSLGGPAASNPISQLWDSRTRSDLKHQAGVSTDRETVIPEDEEVTGKIFEKLKTNAEASYGKRFLFSKPGDVDVIEAAWTVDVSSGGIQPGPGLSFPNNPITGAGTEPVSNPNEYFRNEDGKTRCYVEFENVAVVIDVPSQGGLGIGGGFTLGKGASASQALGLGLAGQFQASKANLELDKSDWLFFNSNLYVAGTIEEDGTTIRLDSPVLKSNPNVNEADNSIIANGPGGQQNIAQNGGKKVSKGNKDQKLRKVLRGDPIILHAQAYQPSRVFVATKNKTLRYGPVFSSNVQANSQGKLVIDQDDGFSPWEFGGFSLMLQSMQFRVDNASSNVKKVETGQINVEGLPKLSIGDSLGFNSNINSISIAFGTSGVRTSYQLRSFLRVFGELTKEELASFSLFARRAGGRFLAQDSVAFINKYRPIITKQFAGRGGRSTSGANGSGFNFE